MIEMHTVRESWEVRTSKRYNVISFASNIIHFGHY